MEFLWKPFWYNIFSSDTSFLQKALKINENFKNKYLNGKNIPDNTFKMLALTPINRINTLKKMSKKPKILEEIVEDDEEEEKQIDPLNSKIDI